MSVKLECQELCLASQLDQVRPLRPQSSLIWATLWICVLPLQLTRLLFLTCCSTKAVIVATAAQTNEDSSDSDAKGKKDKERKSKDKKHKDKHKDKKHKDKKHKDKSKEKEKSKKHSKERSNKDSSDEQLANLKKRKRAKDQSSSSDD
jgi:hypothetical protein